MCGTFGGGGNFRGVSSKIESPIWKVSNDKKHIVFYADASSCRGSTTWCEKHCHLKTKPAVALEKIKPVYKLSHFIKPIHKAIKDDFTKARYVTIFGSGTIDSQFDVDIKDVIFKIPLQHPDKIFRFFIRSKFSRNKVQEMLGLLITPKNAKVIFSADHCTDTDLVTWACESVNVSSIAVVNHKDNKFIIEYLKLKLPVIDCEECQDVRYQCFESQTKNLLLLKEIK